MNKQQITKIVLMGCLMAGFWGRAAWAVSPRTCPAELENLIKKMLTDLPSYANRVLARSRSINAENTRSVSLAGNPEFEPLPLGRQDKPAPDDPNAPKQVFFTTLEQQFTRDRTTSLEHYHWLFLVETSRGWEMVTLYTRFGTTSATGVPSPPEENSKGVMGQAVQLWLRDCRAVRGEN